MQISVVQAKGGLIGFRDGDMAQAVADKHGTEPVEVSVDADDADEIIVCATEIGISPFATTSPEQAALHVKNIQGEGYDARSIHVKVG